MACTNTPLPSDHQTDCSLATNEGMIARMLREGIISDERVVCAFRSVDRSDFLHGSRGTVSGVPGGPCAYDDSEIRHASKLLRLPPNSSALSNGTLLAAVPLRIGARSLSSPSVYGVALEALKLSGHLSFLNIGSGTGYFSALVAQLLDKDAPQVGIDIRSEVTAQVPYRDQRGISMLPFVETQLVEDARDCLTKLGLGQVYFVQCDCFSVDPLNSMRFDRIFIGAGVPANTACWFQLLEVGGTLVAPIETPNGSQRLIRCERISEDSFSIACLMSVNFMKLVRQPALSHASLFVKKWSRRHHTRFPRAFREVITTLLLLHRRPDCVLSVLPEEILFDVIFTSLSNQCFVSHDLPNDQLDRIMLKSHASSKPRPDEFPTRRLGSFSVRSIMESFQSRFWGVNYTCGRTRG